MLAEAGEAARASVRLRGDLAAARERGPCPAAWLLSLRAEALRPGGSLLLQVWAPSFPVLGTCMHMMRMKAEYSITTVGLHALLCHGSTRRSSLQAAVVWAGHPGSAAALPSCHAGQLPWRLLAAVCLNTSVAQVKCLNLAQTLFERLVAEPQGGAACPLLWRTYLAYELGRGRPQVGVGCVLICCILHIFWSSPRGALMSLCPVTPGRLDVQAARRVFLRAIHACPGAAELWRDGFACLGAQIRRCIGVQWLIAPTSCALLRTSPALQHAAVFLRYRLTASSRVQMCRTDC